MALLEKLPRAASRLAPWGLVGLVLIACGSDGNASSRGGSGGAAQTESADNGGAVAGGETRLGEMLDQIDQVQESAADRAAAGESAEQEARGGADGASAGDKKRVSYIPGAQPVEIAEYAVAGETTVFDFYSEFCGPCRQISPFLERLDKARGDLSVVKVDINRPGVRGIDWGSPVARQYRLQSVPHFKIYGPDRKLMSEGEPAYRQIVGWIQQLEG